MAQTFHEWRRDNSGTLADYENYLAGLAEAARRANEPELSLTPAEAVVAWRALDAMDSASFSTEDDIIIAKVTAHFARQLPPRPDDAPHTHG